MFSSIRHFGLVAVVDQALDERPLLEGERLEPFAQGSDVDAFGDAQRVFQFDAEIPHSAIHFGVAEQELDRPKIASLAVYQCGFRPAQGMRPVAARVETNRHYPVADKSGVLACRQVGRRVEPTREGAYIETRNGFDVDGVEIKCRLDFGAKAIDWRGLYKNPGA